VPVVGGTDAGTEGEEVAVGGVGTESKATTIWNCVAPAGQPEDEPSEPLELLELPELESLPPRPASVVFDDSSPTRVTPSMSCRAATKLATAS
jgi:hypothetical protein